MADYPEDLRYSKEHEWVRVEGNVATIGVTKFAVEQLGDVTQVDLPKEGESVKKDDVFGTVEAVKAVSELYSPVAGEVVAVNDRLDKEPALVNTSPYDDGWMVKIKLANASERDALLSADAYSAHLGQ